jgi:hypothetical protein
MMEIVIGCGVLAGANSLIKHKRPVTGAHEQYDRSVKVNIIGGILAVIAVSVLALLLAQDGIRWATLVLLAGSVLQIIGEFRQWGRWRDTLRGRRP